MDRPAISSKVSTNGGKKEKGLSVDTGLDSIPSMDTSPPSLADLTMGSSSSSSHPQTSTEDGCFTPKDQPIKSREERLSLAKEFVRKIGLGWEDLKEKMTQRAKRVMSPDWHCSPQDETKRAPATFRQEFARFVSSLPENLRYMLMKNPSNMFYDDGAVEKYLVIRYQKSGICPLHASSLLQHYVRCKRGGKDTWDHNVLDIGTYIRTRLDPENQRRYILHGTTAYTSSSFFHAITGTTLRQVDIDEYYWIECVYKYFVENREPMLVGCARTFRDKRDPVWSGSFSEEEYETYAKERKDADGRRPPLHSLVIIGAFADDAVTGKKLWFVLQNFWKDAWFHLVDGERLLSMLHATGGAIYKCPKTGNTSLQDGVPTVDGLYSECEIEMEEGDGRWDIPIDPNEPVEEEVSDL